MATKLQLEKALSDLINLVTVGRRSGNPYMIDEVKDAIWTLNPTWYEEIYGSRRKRGRKR